MAKRPNHNDYKEEAGTWAVYARVPEDLKPEVEEALEASEFRSLTHLIEHQLRQFVAKHKRAAERAPVTG